MTPKTLEATALAQEHRQLLTLVRTMHDTIDMLCIALKNARTFLPAAAQGELDAMLEKNEVNSASIHRLLEMQIPPDVSQMEWGSMGNEAE